MNEYRWSFIAIVLFLPALCGAAQKPYCAAEADRVRITNATVIDTRTGQERANQSVEICGNTIAEVHKTKSSDQTDGGRAVDGRGKFIIPGLWDMHAHPLIGDESDLQRLKTFSYPMFLANGVTGARVMRGPPDANKFRALLSANRIVAPRLYIGSPLIDGGDPRASNYSRIRVSTPQQARQVVDEQKRNGADFLKVYDMLSLETYLAIAEESRRQHIPFAGHVPFAVDALVASAEGQRSFEHLFWITIACSAEGDDLRPRYAAATTTMRERTAIGRQAQDSFDEDKCRNMISVLKANRTWVVPTFAVGHLFSNADDPALDKDPRLRYVSPQTREEGRAWTATASPEEVARNRKTYALDEKVVGEMYRAGVPILAGTDVGANWYLFPGFSLHDELQLLVHAGLTPLAALQAATWNAARFMGATDRYGSVTSGKMADLVILDADPLRDITNTQQIYAVVFDGRVLNRSDLDSMLKEIELAAAATKSH
jgi:imidazolonepropionase-like amidohydrolase